MNRAPEHLHVGRRGHSAVPGPPGTPRRSRQPPPGSLSPLFPCESIVRSRGAPWLVGTVRGWLLVGARGSVQRKSPRVGCDDGRAAAESADSSDDGIRQSTNFYAEGARSFLPSRIPPQFLGLSWFTLYFAWAVFVWRFFMQSHRVHLARARQRRSSRPPVVLSSLSCIHLRIIPRFFPSANATRPLLALIFYARIPPICIYLSPWG